MITKFAMATTAAAVMLTGVGVTAAAPADAATYRTYSTCAKLHQDYPRGIAHSKYRIGSTKYVYQTISGRKVRYRPSLISDKAYNQQSLARDRDRDKVHCEVS